MLKLGFTLHWNHLFNVICFLQGGRVFGNLMIPLWFTFLLGDSFVFLDMGPSLFFFVFSPFFGCFGLFMIGKGFIISNAHLSNAWAFNLHQNHLLFQSLCLKRKRNVFMELLRRIWKERGTCSWSFWEGWHMEECSVVWSFSFFMEFTLDMEWCLPLVPLEWNWMG